MTDLSEPQQDPLIQPILEPFQRFIRAQPTSGILLLVVTIVAMVWANSPWAESYETFWNTPVSIVVGSLALTETLRGWINDGLMTMFFFVIGLEIKRELLVGELASFRQAALPLLGAFGGAVLPAILYVCINTNEPPMSGWGIPMATDIAFALGILALVGTCVPVGLKVFLTALAIADDLLAILVIVAYYTSTISLMYLSFSGVCLILLVSANMLGIRHLLVYSVVGIGGLWLTLLLSGIHATIAGVIAAMTIPARTRLTGRTFLAKGLSLLQRFDEVSSPDTPPLANQKRYQIAESIKSAATDTVTPLQRMEDALHPWTTIVIMPLFALANTGVTLDADAAAMLVNPVAVGVIIGLLVGKPVGIVVSCWVAVRGGLATLPEGVSWSYLWASGLLAGIGFTMSLFIAGLAFPHGSLLTIAKIGILVASTMAGTIGWWMLKCAGARR